MPIRRIRGWQDMDGGTSQAGDRTGQTGDRTGRLWTRPLRVHLGVIFVGLLLLVTLPQIWITYSRGHKAADEAIDAEMAVLSERIVDHYHLTFADKLAMVQVGAALESLQTPPPSDLDEKRSFMFEVVELSQALDGLFAGYPDGRFIRIVSLREGSQWRAPLEAPDEAAAAMEMVIPDAEGKPTVRWTFLDGAGKPVSVLPAEPTDFDPRTRPWYREAGAADGPVATEPYLMPFSGAYVKTIADRHRDAPGVVIAADILLESIAHFLHGERISPNAESYVFDDQGKLVVHSEPALMAELMEVARGTRPSDHDYLEEHDPLLASVERLLAETGSGQAHFQLDGETYEVLYVKIGFESVLKGYTIATAAPQSDFTGEIEAQLHQGLMIAAAILVLGIALAVYVSHAISRSLTALTGEALRMKELDFTETEPVRSRTAEIVSLASAIESARTAIRSFGLYVPKELVRRIVGSGLFDRNAAARETVTVMFTDIKDFTTISENNEPEAVVAMLSDYFELINEGVERNGGTIIQFIGDAVYAMWNAPVGDPHHAENACRCALDVRNALDVFNAAQRAAGKPELITRFGVHTGPAVVGNVGAEDRLQYTAIGDTINVASRLEGINKEYGTSILVSRETRDLCPDGFVFTAHGQTAVKGRHEPVEIYEPKLASDQAGGV